MVQLRKYLLQVKAVDILLKQTILFILIQTVTNYISTKFLHP